MQLCSIPIAEVHSPRPLTRGPHRSCLWNLWSGGQLCNKQEWESELITFIFRNILYKHF